MKKFPWAKTELSELKEENVNLKAKIDKMDKRLKEVEKVKTT